MQVKLCAILLAIGLSQVVAYPPLQLNNPHKNLVQFMIQSREVSSNSDHTLVCLDYYLPLMDEVVDTYKADVKACLDAASLEISQINDNTKDERDAIDASANLSCAALTACSAKEGAEDYFKCYSEVGTNNTKTMFTISANASELLAAVQEELRLINVKEEVCTNKTQRTYGENYGALYDDLGSCIGGAPIPSETTSTQASSTDSSTDSSSVSTESSTDSSSVSTESSTDSSTDSSSASTESSTDSSTYSSSASTESSTDSSTDSSSSSSESSTDSSTDSSSVSTESSTDSSTDSSSVSTESSTDSSTDSSSSASTESSTDSSSDSTASSTESSSVSTESTTESDGNKESAPEEDLKSLSTQNSNDLQKILKNLRVWFKTH
ncbi:cell wall protein IFF6 isoform X3 [Drosophila teissieri]|uniref:cell wall protein IFF6 isoform X2 n=1 Tax=Drosophila teissieri TaxID=7243 RepID=UPI001CB9DEC1|nr:cell wall protein IFF6 isoform X2 [Drosophila teissieri]XP_043643560.1 cell wall protein IFF6 isoform X3 [Drosophila teissieri]